MLQPDSNWRWYYDHQHDRLALLLGDMLFLTPYRTKHLAYALDEQESFDLQDLEVYSQVANQLEHCPLRLSAAQQTQLAINVCATQRFHKPLMPKSWFFDRHQQGGHHHRLAWLTCGEQRAKVWVVEDNQSSCLCLLLDDQLPLTNGKALGQFEAIRVMLDCLEPCFEQQPLRKLA
ncbi:cell division protein ZapC domain-containing protein [Bowmanella yangjiangensis]|uniref:Cell division protein ZapC n=1 Tax=Bowmanella yangjiangensis TaxID=2811230 RepID=A0ABS3CWP2_9ALTE|nr:cell division protein ZapC domain-containing protein [Bowmanella yangjiangensis]MBN7820561.1 cell division protein ZapC [Bowmanella yangjiangensis]